MSSENTFWFQKDILCEKVILNKAGKRNRDQTLIANIGDSNINYKRKNQLFAVCERLEPWIQI